MSTQPHTQSGSVLVTPLPRPANAFAKLRRFTAAAALAAIAPKAGYAERIEIRALPGLRYDMVEFSARPGEELELVLINDDEMQHNLVITTPGSREEVVNAAIALGAQAAARGYVPESKNVLWHSAVLSGGESQSLRFTAPAETGDYPYVCTFPGHGFVMFGKMVVTESPQAPVFSQSPAAAHSPSGDKPISGEAVTLRRFMPDSGPASIAVGLPGGISYCWDAGAVRFRYAWAGGFANEVYRKPMELVGEVFYREENGYPLRVGDDPKRVPEAARFLGYQLDSNAYPTFEYTVDGLKVRESISVDDGWLTRRFQIENPPETEPIWFAIPDGQETSLRSSGERIDRFYKFAGERAKELTIQIKIGKEPTSHESHH